MGYIWGYNPLTSTNLFTNFLAHPSSFWKNTSIARRTVGLFVKQLDVGADLQVVLEQQIVQQMLLVGVFNPFEKYYIVKLEIFPK